MKNCFIKSLLLTALLWRACPDAFAMNLGVFAVDDGTSHSRPAVIVNATSGTEWAAFSFKLSNGTSEFLSSSTKRSDGASLRFEVPRVSEDTYVEIALTTGSELSEGDFRWRTLARPDGKSLMSYKGKKKFLPPEDFESYWHRAVHQLDGVSSNPRVVRQPDRDTTTGLLYKVELDSVENTTIVGWYFVPRLAYKNGNPDEGIVRKFPAILITPGYGAEEPPIDRTKEGYITFSTNPRNHGPSKAYWKSPGEHLIYNITEPESYYYKLANLDCLQSARFVFGRDEVDTEYVGTEGGSQGGYLAVATAMLEPRIKCVAANVMAFTDYADGIELAAKGGQSHIRDLLNDENASTSLIARSLSYTDGANLIGHVKVPIQINMGSVDPVCPYICGIVAYNRIASGVAKEFHTHPTAAHEVGLEMRKWNRDWFTRWLKPDAANDSGSAH